MTKKGESQIKPSLTERQLQDWIVEVAKVCGWRIHHTRPAWTNKGWRTPIQGDAGFFDLVLVKGARLLLIELKSEKGKLSPEQQDWHDAIDLMNRLRLRKGYNNPVEKFLFRPSDRDEIEQLLR